MTHDLDGPTRAKIRELSDLVCSAVWCSKEMTRLRGIMEKTIGFPPDGSPAFNDLIGGCQTLLLRMKAQAFDEENEIAEAKNES